MRSLVNDEYRWRARLQPALLVLFPAALVLGLGVTWTLGDWGAAWRFPSGTVASLVTTIGVLTLVEQLVRDRGKRKELGLWASWGGAPATRMLRHRETELSTPIKRAHYHQKLKRLMRDIRIPTAAEEERDPSAADQVYERCVQFLKTQTRDRTRFRLIFEENVNYGFCRNLWAMRPAGLAVAAIGTAASAYFAGVAPGVSGDLRVVGGLVALVDAGFLVWWLFRINRALVFVPAKAWSERLFEALDEL